MKHISVKLSDEDYKKVQTSRGQLSTSDYVRKLLFDDHQAAQKEGEDFQQLFKDITAIKSSMTSFSQGGARHSHVLALGLFMADISKLANPPAYAKYEDRIRQLIDRLNSQLNNGG